MVYSSDPAKDFPADSLQEHLLPRAPARAQPELSYRAMGNQRDYFP
jgi:hypothetical protein